MEYFETKSGLKLSRLILGTWQWGGSTAGWQNNFQTISQADQLLEKAHNFGINTIDTARVYGEAEELLGKALKHSRNQFILMTKGFGGPRKLKTQIVNSLKRLNTDIIDVYFLHYPAPNVALAEQVYALVEARSQGLIKAIGLSNFSAQQLNSIAPLLPEVDLLQNNFNVLWQPPDWSEIVNTCRQNSIAIITYSPLIQGLPLMKEKPASHIIERNIFLNRTLYSILEALREKLIALSEKYQYTSAQILISWVLHSSDVSGTIIGTTNTKHLKEATEALNLKLAPEDYARLEAFGIRARKYIDFSKNMWGWKPRF